MHIIMHMHIHIIMRIMRMPFIKKEVMTHEQTNKQASVRPSVLLLLLSSFSFAQQNKTNNALCVCVCGCCVEIVKQCAFSSHNSDPWHRLFCFFVLFCFVLLGEISLTSAFSLLLSFLVPRHHTFPFFFKCQHPPPHTSCSPFPTHFPHRPSDCPPQQLTPLLQTLDTGG